MNTYKSNNQKNIILQLTIQKNNEIYTLVEWVEIILKI